MSEFKGALFTDSAVYRPFAFPWAVELTKEHEQTHWIEEEAKVGEDVADWKGGKLTAAEREFIIQILRLFTQSDVAVGGYYYDKLIPAIRNNEVRVMLGSFAAREGVHQRAYSMVNDTIGLPEGDYAAFLDYAEMRAKYEFMTEADTSTPIGFGYALAKGVFNEGVTLFASFAMLLNFQRRGLLKGMCKVVEWSQRDETIHVQGNARLFRVFCAAHPEIITDRFKHHIYDTARQVVALEDAFIDLAYKAGFVEGLSKSDVKTYIRYVTDRRLVQLGLKPNFMVSENPLGWLDWIVGASRHTNFFESRVSDYEVSGLQGSDWGYDPVEAPGHTDLMISPEAINETLAQLPPYDSSKRWFEVYTKPGCPWCQRAKELLQAGRHNFTLIDLADGQDRADFYHQHGFDGEQRTMPKIWVCEADASGCHLRQSLIGGYNDLVIFLDREGRTV